MKTAILFLILILLANLILGVGLKFYRFNYFDTTLHFLGGFFIAMFLAQYLGDSIKESNPHPNKIKMALIIVGAAVFIGVMWEFIEYLATNFLGQFLVNKYNLRCCIGNLDDTINDLTMDILGAAVFVLILMRKKLISKPFS